MSWAHPLTFFGATALLVGGFFSYAVWIDALSLERAIVAALVCIVAISFVAGCILSPATLGKRATGENKILFEGKFCNGCKKQVPFWVRAGDRCPHCSARFVGEKREYF